MTHDRPAIPSQAEELEPAEAALTAALPSDMALLRIIPTRFGGRDCFRLELHFDGVIRTSSSPEDLRNQGRPDLVLADIEAKGLWLESYNALRSWSSTKLKLNQWLTDMRGIHGPNLRLIVWDETDFEIPWELFFHETDDAATSGWLGAHIQVTRWTTVHKPGTQYFGTVARQCEGAVLAFEARDISRSPKLLERYQTERAHSLGDLLIRLGRNRVDARRVGLVYVRCHGHHGTNGAECTLDGISLDQFNGYRMEALRAWDTIVFLNACAAVRIMVDSRFGERATRSFAEIFLRRGAHGVVGTVGAVAVDHSHEFAFRLLTGSEARGRKLSASLLEHRAHYASQLPQHLDSTHTEKLRAFFYSFMYVYFGHPDTELKLSAADRRGCAT